MIVIEDTHLISKLYYDYQEYMKDRCDMELDGFETQRVWTEGERTKAWYVKGK